MLYHLIMIKHELQIKMHQVSGVEVMEMTGAIDALHADREAMLKIGTGLTDAEWATASGCPGWSVKDVLAHLGTLLRLLIDPASLPDLDARADAFLANHVANRASRTQGRAFLSTAARVFPERMAPVQERAAGLKLHLSPVWGAAVSALGLGLLDAQRVFLWTTARNVLSAAVRLGLIGTHEAQALLAELSPLLDEVQATCGQLGVDALAQPAPLADLIQGTHDRLYSRLFQS